ncbi:hypothetical protein LEMLEM_LOCUS15472 [Lemmus lemmus]
MRACRLVPPPLAWGRGDPGALGGRGTKRERTPRGFCLL